MTAFPNVTKGVVLGWARDYEQRAARWRHVDKNGRRPNGWDKDSCEHEALVCDARAEEFFARAEKLPVKIVYIYADGTEEIQE